MLYLDPKPCSATQPPNHYQSTAVHVFLTVIKGVGLSIILLFFSLMNRVWRSMFESCSVSSWLCDLDRLLQLLNIQFNHLLNDDPHFTRMI